MECWSLQASDTTTGKLWRAGSELRSLGPLRGVFVAQEGRLLGQLAQAMQGVPHEDVFDTWMKRQSDLVQATALAYAEREVLEASMRAVQEVCLIYQL